MAQSRGELIPTRTTLLERLKNWRDDSSWQEFFDIYWKLIYGTAMKSGLTDAEAKDVVQEAMISVAKHIPQFKYDPSIGSFKHWLLNMTRWRITDQFRKRQRLLAETPTKSGGGSTIGTQWMDKMADPNSLNLEGYWDEEWEKNLLNVAVMKVKRRLEPEKYQIFDCYVNKEWEPEKVAKTFGISVDQVYVAKYRVTALIKKEAERLKKEVI